METQGEKQQIEEHTWATGGRVPCGLGGPRGWQEPAPVSAPAPRRKHTASCGNQDGADSHRLPCLPHTTSSPGLASVLVPGLPSYQKMGINLANTRSFVDPRHLRRSWSELIQTRAARRQPNGPPRPSSHPVPSSRLGADS